jgi:predicted CoA-substrate-specific enzyme activase
MEYYCGIDIGSSTTKAVLIDSEKKIISKAVLPTGYDVEKVSQEVFRSLLEKSGVKRDDILKIVSTGYGRFRVKFAQKNITEITCHAKGAFHLFPGTRTIIDIGGQDSKAISIDEKGRVIDFAMNDKCAAGTGRFLENMGRVLQTDLEEMGRIGSTSREMVKITSTCTVFAESEVISLIHQGKSRESIISGLFEAIVLRIIPLATRVGLKRELTLTGGVAKNEGIISAFKRVLGFDVNLPDDPQVVGALGAALIAYEEG